MARAEIQVTREADREGYRWDARISGLADGPQFLTGSSPTRPYAREVAHVVAWVQAARAVARLLESEDLA